MLHSNERIIKHKVGLLNLAEELGNVSKACQIMGLSRDTFYRYKSAVDEVRGLEAVSAEWSLVTMAWNIRRMAVLRG